LGVKRREEEILKGKGGNDVTFVRITGLRERGKKGRGKKLGVNTSKALPYPAPDSTKKKGGGERGRVSSCNPSCMA